MLKCLESGVATPSTKEASPAACTCAPRYHHDHVLWPSRGLLSWSDVACFDFFQLPLHLTSVFARRWQVCSYRLSPAHPWTAVAKQAQSATEGRSSIKLRQRSKYNTSYECSPWRRQRHPLCPPRSSFDMLCRTSPSSTTMPITSFCLRTWTRFPLNPSPQRPKEERCEMPSNRYLTCERCDNYGSCTN